MRVLLCTPDCGPLPLSDWSLIGDLQFDGIRTDVRRPGDAPALVANVVAAGKDAIFIADHRQGAAACLEIVTAIASAIGPDARPEMFAIEVGNECDLSGPFVKDPDGFGRLVANAANAVRVLSPNTRVVSGGISHCGKDKLKWLKSAIRHFPAEVAVGYHPYRDTGPGEGRPDYGSRGEEFASLAVVVGTHQAWCTEIGWHTAPRKKRPQWTDGQVEIFLRDELQREKEFGAEVMAIFQIHDGPDPNQYEHRFGIRRVDGALKPSAYVIRGWRV